MEAEVRYRDTFCPGYGDIACDCPFYVVPCDGAWNCADIIGISDIVMNSFDSNGDL